MVRGPVQSRRKAGGRRRPWWADLPKQELLDVRIRDLELRIPGSVLESRVEQLRSELVRAGLRFQPYVWLSTDWFTPDGVTGFAIPFYLAHPRLARLERQQMFEVEGVGQAACMKLLRHEAAHALDNAYRLRRRPRWKSVFGAPGRSYGASYVPRPTSRAFVLNLDHWYAQSHPVEDFAETFAVWLQPRSAWRRRYSGWPALAKLEYVDELMREVGPLRPRVRSREHVHSLRELRMTLREHYREKQSRYGQADRSVYDRDLLRLFTAEPSRRRRAASFLRERRRLLRDQVSTWTGQYAFVVDTVLREMIQRCRELDLHLSHSERETGIGAAVLLTVHTIRLVRRRQPEYFR